tara:strand:- start:174 stop:311 length:138 start_codon:yes stop_codon:yes gene_type:complete
LEFFDRTDGESEARSDSSLLLTWQRRKKRRVHKKKRKRAGMTDFA